MALVKNVLGPYFKKELYDNIQYTPFSFMIDESTAVSHTKLVATSIRYYSQTAKKIVNTYLGMEEIIHTDALSLEGADCSYLKSGICLEMIWLGLELMGPVRWLDNTFSPSPSTSDLATCGTCSLCCSCFRFGRYTCCLGGSYVTKCGTHDTREPQLAYSHSSVCISAYYEIAKLTGFTSNPDEEDKDDHDSSGVTPEADFLP